MDPDNPPTQATILAGGECRVPPTDAHGAFVIAADSGYDLARTADLRVDLLVGDLDSISPEGLRHATDHGVTIERHPVDKDATDFELALAAAVDRRMEVIDVHGGEGGSLAHLFGVATALASVRWSTASIRWHTHTGLVRIAHRNRDVHIAGAVGDVVSIIPVGDATGVTTDGLEWRLDATDLPAGTTRGLSNRMSHPAAKVAVADGSLIVIWEGSHR